MAFNNAHVICVWLSHETKWLKLYSWFGLCPSHTNKMYLSDQMGVCQRGEQETLKIYLSRSWRKFSIVCVETSAPPTPRPQCPNKSPETGSQTCRFIEPKLSLSRSCHTFWWPCGQKYNFHRGQTPVNQKLCNHWPPHIQQHKPPLSPTALLSFSLCFSVYSSPVSKVTRTRLFLQTLHPLEKYSLVNKPWTSPGLSAMTLVESGEGGGLQRLYLGELPF